MTAESELSRLKTLLSAWNAARVALVTAPAGTSTIEMWKALAEAEDDLRKAAI